MVDYNKIYTDNENKWTSEERDDFVLDNIDEPTSLLDIGCGNGHTIEHLARYWPNTKFYGVDISQVAIDIAKKKVPEATFVCGTSIDKDVDVALLMGVAEHFENLKDLENIKAKIVYLEVPNCLSYSDSDEEGFRKTGEQMEWHLRRETWEDVIKDCGYKIIERLDGGRPSWQFVWILRR